MMNEMLERVAQALYEDQKSMGDPLLEQTGEVKQFRFYRRARVAIQTMREPTEAMRWAGNRRIGEWGARTGESAQWLPPYNIETRWAGKRAVDIYQAMLNEALTKEQDDATRTQADLRQPGQGEGHVVSDDADGAVAAATAREDVRESECSPLREEGKVWLLT